MTLLSRVRSLPSRRRPLALGALAALLVSAALLAGCAADADHLYTCPMHPDYISEKPGDCPICGMTLVPLKADAPKPKAADHQHQSGQPAAGAAGLHDLPGGAAGAVAPGERDPVGAGGRAVVAAGAVGCHEGPEERGQEPGISRLHSATGAV